MDGSLKPRIVSIYNEKCALLSLVEIEAMREAYNLLKMKVEYLTPMILKERIDRDTQPGKYNVKVEEVETLLDRFNRYIDGFENIRNCQRRTGKDISYRLG